MMWLAVRMGVILDSDGIGRAFKRLLEHWESKGYQAVE